MIPLFGREFERELEKYRDSLPHYRRYEQYVLRIGPVGWDVTKARFIVEVVRPRKPVRIGPIQVARMYGYLEPDDTQERLAAAKPGEGVSLHLTFAEINEEWLKSGKVDPERPALAIQQVLTHAPGRVGTWVIDGHHGICLAARAGRAAMPCYLLNEEEEPIVRL